MPSKQEIVKEWFNKTYRSRGLSYLRPIEAYHIFIRILNIGKDKNILDVGCGPGLLLKLAKREGASVYGVDLSDSAIEMCKSFVPDVEAKVANAEALPFPDKYFNNLTCIGSMERFINPENALKEFIRVGKDDCQYLIMVRNSNHLSWKIFKQFFGLKNTRGNQNARSPEQWRELFNKYGFSIQKEYADPWPSIRWRRWLWLSKNRERFIKLKSDPKQMNNAYEIIFFMKKKHP